MKPPATPIATTCPYCGVGCGVIAQVSDKRLQSVAGDPTHPANRGSLCIKGTTLAQTQTDSGRLLTPYVNHKPATWDHAITSVAEGFQQSVQEHGPDSVAFYLSGQLLTEDYYVANKLMKGFLGSANVDTNSRLCMASAVAAHKRAFGEDVVPCNYEDLDHCRLLLMVGSNAAWAHPVVYQRIVKAKQNSNLKVVLLDPRRTATADLADVHLALRPGSDSAFFTGLLHYLQDNGLLNQGYIDAHTSNLEHCIESTHISTEVVSALTDLSIAEIEAVYADFAQQSATVTLFSQGVNQSSSGTDTANAIINCHLATGRIGQLGSGPFSITGQPNAMGGREVGGMANQLAAHMDFTPANVEHVGHFWQAPNMARSPGLKAVDMFDAVHRGQIKALWIMGTNPAVSLPNSNHVRAALTKCPLVVVSDCVVHTSTNEYADVLLPALGWGEKDGTVTNSVRQISRQRRFLDTPGQARADWQIITNVAQRLGFGKHFGYTNPRDIFIEHAALSGVANAGKRLFNLAHLQSLSVSDYNALSPSAWPRNQRPFADGVFSTPSGRAQFVATPHQQRAQIPTLELPFTVNTGRTRDQWHTMTRTGTHPALFKHRSQPRIEIHPLDARALRIAEQDLVEVHNHLGRVRCIAEITDSVRPQEVFVPIHWNNQYAWPVCVSELVDAVTDPVSGQPESKHAVANLRKIEVATWIRIITSESKLAKELHAWTDQGESLCYWHRTPFDGGWQYDIACVKCPIESGLQQRLISTLESLNHAPTAASFEYRSQTAEVGRWLGDHQGVPRWLMFSGPRLEHLAPVSQLASLLVPGQSAPWQRLGFAFQTDQPDNSPQVCTCFEVSERCINEAIGAGATTAAELGTELGCGTNCGSCIPELNYLLRKGAIPTTSLIER